jgi:PPIC-type PPIASE domain
MRWFLLLLLATSMVFAQATHTNPSKAGKPASSADEDQEEQATPPGPKVAPDAAVITIQGLCEDKPHAATPAGATKAAKTAAATNAACETIITRAQFERLADSLQPKMPPQVKRQLASSYPRILTMAHEARKRGLDKDPGFQEKLQFARQQLLMQELNRTIQTEAAKIPDRDIEDYYRKNPSAYEEATLQRVYVPKSKRVEPSKDAAKPEDVKAQQDAAEAIMTKEADALRARAVAGEDFEKLQKEAFEVGAVNSPPTATKLENMRPTNIPPAHASVFALKPNEVSPVISDASGHYIYKLVSQKLVPLDQVKDEIRTTLQSQKVRDTLLSIQNSTTLELNNAYFGPSPAPPARGPVKPGGQPGSKEPPNAPAKPQ